MGALLILIIVSECIFAKSLVLFLFFFFLDGDDGKYSEPPLVEVTGFLCVIKFKPHAYGRVDLYAFICASCVRVHTSACVPYDHWGVVGELRVPDICPPGYNPSPPPPSAYSYRAPPVDRPATIQSRMPRQGFSVEQVVGVRVSGQVFFLMAGDMRHPVSFVSTADYCAKYRIRWSSFSLSLSLSLSLFLRLKGNFNNKVTRQKHIESVVQ